VKDLRFLVGVGWGVIVVEKVVMVVRAAEKQVWDPDVGVFG
jgi:hypothetical protein